MVDKISQGPRKALVMILIAAFVFTQLPVGVVFAEEKKTNVSTEAVAVAATQPDESAKTGWQADRREAA